MEIVIKKISAYSEMNIKTVTTFLNRIMPGYCLNRETEFDHKVDNCSNLFRVQLYCFRVSFLLVVSECNSVYCLNGGACRDETSGYKCECRFGFYGKRCEGKFQ